MAVGNRITVKIVERNGNGNGSARTYDSVESGTGSGKVFR